jgi:hypothetical protein
MHVIGLVIFFFVGLFFLSSGLDGMSKWFGPRKR